MSQSTNQAQVLHQLLRGQATIISTLQEIIQIMSTQPSALQFSDLQAAINQIINDNTAQNNAVAAQIKEVQSLITDFDARSQQGNAPTQADYQAAIAQLQAVHSLVQQNTAAIQASGNAVAQADPNAAPADQVQASEPAPAVDTSASTTGNAGTSAIAGGALEPGTGEPNQTHTGPATVGENTSSGVASEGNSTLG